MARDKLVAYIRKELRGGFSQDKVRNFLLKKGYEKEELDETFKKATKSSFHDAPGFTVRNPGLVFLFTVISFGWYGVYWLVSTSAELRKNDAPSAPNPWHLLAVLIPGVGFVVLAIYMWNYFRAVEEVTEFNNVLLFVLLLVFPPASMVLTQLELNKRAA